MFINYSFRILFLSVRNRQLLPLNPVASHFEPIIFFRLLYFWWDMNIAFLHPLEE